MRPYSLFLFAFAIALAGCGGSARAPLTVSAAGAAPARVAIHAVPAAMQQWPRRYEASGTVRARASTVVSAKWMGYAREVNVRVGDRVRAGQLLVRLDARELDAASERASDAIGEIRSSIPEAESAIAAAKANLDLAQVTFRRMNELYEKRSISDQEFDEASAKLKAAQASFDMARARRAQLDPKLAQAEQQLRAAEIVRGYAEIAAPTAGIVTAKSIEPGDLAAPGAPLLAIESESYRLEAQVEESNLAAIRIGQTASVALDGVDRPFEARVSEIVPAVDSAARAYTVKLDLPLNLAIRSGIFGRALFALGTRSVLAIPGAAVTQRGQLQSIFTAENGVARTRLVTLGETFEDGAEILSGLNAGELVVFPVPGGLEDGTRIEVRQ